MTLTNFILVHGAWADGSSWAKVIPLLAAKKGTAVTAVQLPLTSFEADVAAVCRAIALTQGDVVLVGHSYAGAVIGQAGNEPKVKRLVYIDAFAPDAGESAASLFAQFKAAPLNEEIRPDTQGFLSIWPFCRSIRNAWPPAWKQRSNGSFPATFRCCHILSPSPTSSFRPLPDMTAAAMRAANLIQE